MLEKNCPKCGGHAVLSDNSPEAPLKCTKCEHVWTPGEEAEFSRIPSNEQLAAEVRDSGNPCQPPSYAPEADETDRKEEVFAEGFVHTRITTGELLDKLWNLITKRFDRILLAMLIQAAISLPFLIVFGLATYGAAILFQNGDLNEWIFISLNRFCDIMQYIISIYLIAGGIQFWLDLARGGKGEFKLLFPGGGVFGRTLGVCMIQFVIFALISAVVFLPFTILTGLTILSVSDLIRMQHFIQSFGSYELILLSCCAFINMIAVTLVAVRIAWAEVFAIDGKAGIFKSIRYAYRFSRGNFISILLNRIIWTLAVICISMVTCCFGSIAIENIIISGLNVMIYFGTTGQRVRLEKV